MDIPGTWSIRISWPTHLTTPIIWFFCVHFGQVKTEPPGREGPACRVSLDCPKSTAWYHHCHFLTSAFSSCGDNSVPTAHSQ